MPQKFIEQVSYSIESIRMNPFAFAVRYCGVPIANLKVFPYAIHYLLDKDVVIVIAVHHTAMNPERWETRFNPDNTSR